MAYSSKGKLPPEKASKLGHLTVINSEWVKSLIENFEDSVIGKKDYDTSLWSIHDFGSAKKLNSIWSVDGSFVSVKANPPTGKEVSFIKSALLNIDQNNLKKIDKENPHPLLLQDIMNEKAVYHSTALPLKNVKTSLGNNYTTVRHIIFDSMKIDQDGVYLETLKWLAYQKWSNLKEMSPKFKCPHCFKEIPGLPYDSSKGSCPYCKNEVLLTDMIGFHLDMEEDSAPEQVASAYMMIMEHLMLFTIIRLLWNHSDKKIISEALFIKDGPLTLRSQYSKLVPLIRNFLEYTKLVERPVHIIGQEKSGIFYDHLSIHSKFIHPKTNNENPSIATLSHEYVRKEVYRTGNLENHYGSRTNWGEKVFVKLDPDTAIVLNIPTGNYCEDLNFPKQSDLIGIDRIMATIPELVSRRYESGLYPIELVNGIASLSSYPSAQILKLFVENSK